MAFYIMLTGEPGRREGGGGQLNTQYSIVRPMNPYPRTPHSLGFDTGGRVSGWPVRPKGGGGN